MDLTNQVKIIVRAFEGYSANVYICPAGHPTIAYGHRCEKNRQQITKAEGETLLSQDVTKAIFGALKYCPTLINHHGRLVAIADFCLNLGVGRLQTSTLRRKINQNDFAGAKKELMKWIYGGGKILRGLVRRRIAEVVIMENH
jgi:lysozyme